MKQEINEIECYGWFFSRKSADDYLKRRFPGEINYLVQKVKNASVYFIVRFG